MNQILYADMTVNIQFHHKLISLKYIKRKIVCIIPCINEDNALCRHTYYLETLITKQ